MLFAGDPLLHIGSSYNGYDTLSSALTLGISIFGVYCCYRVNASGDDRDLIVRIMCIGLPVMIRVAVVFFPVSVIGGILQTTFLYPESLDEDSVESTPILALI